MLDGQSRHDREAYAWGKVVDVLRVLHGIAEENWDGTDGTPTFVIASAIADALGEAESKEAEYV